MRKFAACLAGRSTPLLGGTAVRRALIVVSLASAFAATGEEPSSEQICELKSCRASGLVQISLGDDRYFEVDLGGTVIAHELNISVYPGETHAISTQLQGKQIVDLAPATTTGDVADQLIVSMSQIKAKDGAIETLLKVTNPFSYPLRYDAYMDLDGSSEFQYTSSCPVGAKASSYEHWPQPIIHIVMTNVRLLTEEDDAESSVCK